MKVESTLRPGMISYLLRSRVFRGVWSRSRLGAGNCNWTPSHGGVEFPCNRRERSKSLATWQGLRRGYSPQQSLCTGTRRRWRTSSGSSADRITVCAACSRWMPRRRAASDMLAWYRAVHPDVAEGVTAEQYFTGGMILRGWPLVLESAALSSGGGIVRVPGFAEPVRIGSMSGGRERGVLAIGPV